MVMRLRNVNLYKAQKEAFTLAIVARASRPRITSGSGGRDARLTNLLLRMLVHVEIDLLANAVEDVAVAFFQGGAGDGAAEGADE